MEAQRYPISIRLIGVIHKEKSKMYMTSVLWSDENDIVVYRSFREFKKMHKQMKKAFPPTNRLEKSDRVIPKFRDKKMKRSGQRKGPAKSLVLLKFLQNYCNDLLSCDAHVTQSPHLIQFFRPKDQDLQPEFSKNGVVVMPSDDDGGVSRAHGTGGGNVTQPFVTETYSCVAPYETKDTKNKPFKVALDEKVDVLIKDKTGWWLVEKEDKRLAWFPAPYLEKLDDDDDNNGEEDELDGTYGKRKLYMAIKSYKAAKDDEITVSIGSVVEVLQKSDNGWWLIRYNGKVGYIPTMYLQPYNNPHVRMAVLQTDRQSSLQVPSASLAQSQQLSRSQGNLLQLPRVSAPLPSLLQLESKHRSRSLDLLSKLPPAQLASRKTSATNLSNSHVTVSPFPVPTIKVEMNEEDRRNSSLTVDSEGSFDSDSTDFSLSDASSISSASSLSWSHDRMDLRLSHTPLPMMSNRLTPTSGLESKISQSVSDPNLYKGPTTPKVPPRPQAQEILARCTAVTHKNASRGVLSPTQTEIIGC
ncbi:hypothetical protein LDENG_00091890 [Lucifuga dentata]|nr:hypothetical protein LDENG_00091890 [Lucifuga dentata]